jgi:D-alanyl-D-alanine carboxypeptidase
MTRSRSTGLLLAMAVAVVLGAAPAASAAASGRPVRQRLNRVIATLTSLQVPGGVIGVTGGPVGRYTRAFGSASSGVPMTPGTHFRIGSISKTFTATVILELVDRHRLRLDQTIARWEPRVPNADRITIRMLLGMTSGIWDEGGNGPTGRESLLGKWVDAHCMLAAPSPDCGRYWRPQQIVDLAIREGPAAYPPGVYYYSDTNYVILGIIAQKVMHRSLGALVRRLILSPLHMTQTSFPTRTLALARPAASGYMAVPAPTPTHYVPGTVPSPSTLFGAGNAVSTLADLRIWARALGTGVLLKPATQRIRLATFPIGGEFYPLAGSELASVLPLSYGLGITRIGNLLGHNGAVAPFGFTAETWYLPRIRGTVVVLLNSITPCTIGVLSDSLAGTLPQMAFGRVASGAVAAPVLQGDGCAKLNG